MFKQFFILKTTFVLIAVLLQISITALASDTQKAEPIEFDKASVSIITTADYEAYIVKIPKQASFVVKPVVEEILKPLPYFLQKTDALAVINGGFFDPKNHKTVSHVQVQNTTWNPEHNERLMENDGLKPYLPDVFNRTEFRTYQCSQTGDVTHHYVITQHKNTDDYSAVKTCSLIGVLGAGPQLLPSFTPEKEAFWAKKNGKVIRDPLGIYRKNARSAVGLTQTGDVLIVAVSQRPVFEDDIKNGVKAGAGITIPQLIQLLKTNGAVQAMALDGGSSTGLFLNDTISQSLPLAEPRFVTKQPKAGHIVWGKWRQSPESSMPVVRSLKSVLAVIPIVPSDDTETDSTSCGFALSSKPQPLIQQQFKQPCH